MVNCGACGLPGHNNRNPECRIKCSLSNMYKFTHTGSYYILSLKYILSKYPNKICLSPVELSWDNDRSSFTNLDKAFISRMYCNLDFIYIKLNLRDRNSSHANYIILNIRTGIFFRYEPHGSNTQNYQLDLALYNFAILNNYVYIPPKDFCPYIGIQTMALDTAGLCQTSVLYSLLSVLDPVNYDYVLATSESNIAMYSLVSLASELLINVYMKLSSNLRDKFIRWNSLSQEDRLAIHKDLSIFI